MLQCVVESLGSLGTVSVRTLPFGELALLEDLITREQLQSTLSYQAERRDASKPDRKLGTLLVHQGYLTREEARTILRLQRDRGPIDGYVLVDRLGSGGMGTVFRAIQKSLEREVALKILTPRASRHDRYRARFLQEAKLLAQLRHPNLVRAFEVGESQGHLYFAMEFVRGRTARDLIARYGHIPEPQTLDYMEQIASAISHYGEQRILHRDIKPENILITETGEAKLADLGLSKRLDEECHITRPGKTLGTPLYISPELARGDDLIDVRSDLYSYGATFYHLACGVPPFEAVASADLLTAHVREIPRAPRDVNPILSEGLDALLMRLLEKKPENRFDTPEKLIEAIQRVRRGEPIDDEPAPKRKRERGDGSSGERSAARIRAARRTSSAENAALPRDRERTASARRTGAFPAVGSTGTTRNARPPRSGTFAVLVIAAAALVGGVVALQGEASRNAVAATPKDPIDLLRALAKHDPQAALSELRAFELAHATEPEAVLARYDAVSASLVGAVAARERFVKDREDAAAAAFDELRLDVRDLVEVRGDRTEALKHLEAFSTRWRGTKAWSQRDALRTEITSGK